MRFCTLDALILTLDDTVEPFSFGLALEEKPTREQFRRVLEYDSPLGKAEKDVFFPKWTKSPYMVCVDRFKDNTPTFKEVDDAKSIIDSDEKLHEFLDKQEQSPGSFALVVQQTRNPEYSRKKGNPSRRKRRANARDIWESQPYHGFQTAPLYHLGMGETQLPIYLDPQFVHIGFLPTNPYYPPPSAPCYAIPVNFTNQMVLPAPFQTGHFY